MLQEKIQLRHRFKVISGSTPESGKGFYWDGDIFWVTPEDLSSLKEGYYLYDTKRKITDEGYSNSGVTLAPINSIVLTKRAPIGLLAILGVEACSNQGCFLLIPNEKIEPRFFYYYLLANKEYLQILGRGSTFMELSLDDIKSFKIPDFSINMQKKVAEFLDGELTHIDSLILRRQRQLVLLQEQRQALISQAVTKGIDTKVKLKESEIDWLGDIPQHWEVKKLKYVVEKIDEIVDGADFIIAVENIESFTGNLVNVEQDNFYEGALYKFRSNDIIFNKLRPYLNKVFFAKNEGACVGELLILRPNENIIPEYLFYLMLSSKFIDEVNSSTVGAKMPRANWDDFIKHIKIPLPLVDEQLHIVDSIKKNLEFISKTAEATKFSLKLLSEKKASLIFNCVTGKIKSN